MRATPAWCRWGSHGPLWPGGDEGSSRPCKISEHHCWSMLFDIAREHASASCSCAPCSLLTMISHVPPIPLEHHCCNRRVNTPHMNASIADRLGSDQPFPNQQLTFAAWRPPSRPQPPSPCRVAPRLCVSQSRTPHATGTDAAQDCLQQQQQSPSIVNRGQLICFALQNPGHALPCVGQATHCHRANAEEPWANPPCHTHIPTCESDRHAYIPSDISAADMCPKQSHTC
jgi:hypothetical protein